jgi:outer membrane lipopolysaccharide assembly protein LptE/RlpB
MRLEKLALVILVSAALAGCGYRLAARKGDVGGGQTIAVPTFVNNTTSYRLEQRMSEAVRKELARTTHYKVSSTDTGDVVLRGEVLDYSTTPTVLDESGRASQYLVSVLMKVSVTERATGKMLFQNNSMTLRDTFQLSPNAGDFVPEDPAAVERLGNRFAEAVVTALVRR